MSDRIPIHALAKELGLTSRTLRHWEAEGLFVSCREQSSGWRVYDEDAALRARLIRLLREMNIAIKDIRSFIVEGEPASLVLLMHEQMEKLAQQEHSLSLQSKRLGQMHQYLLDMQDVAINRRTIDRCALFLHESAMTNNETEEKSMEYAKEIRYITLPPMRVAYHVAVGTSPEDEAMRPVIDWLKAEKLLGTARLFGGNMPPMPGEPGAPYGYGMCATIPESAVVPKGLQEMLMPGGLYAAMESGDDIGASWQALMQGIAREGQYKPDPARLCYEEHTRSNRPEGSGSEYYLTLLEPVK